MQEDNPYRAPDANLYASPGASESAGVNYWRDGKDLIVRHDTVLPHRCVKCNAQIQRAPKPRRFYWHHAGLYLLILINLLLYALIAVFVRKKVLVSVGLCEGHIRRRRMIIVGAWIVTLTGLAIMVAGISADRSNAEWMLIGILLVLIASVVGIVGTRVLRPLKIDDFFARLRGCDQRFLHSLPQFSERRTRR